MLRSAGLRRRRARPASGGSGSCAIVAIGEHAGALLRRRSRGAAARRAPAGRGGRSRPRSPMDEAARREERGRRSPRRHDPPGRSRRAGGRRSAGPRKRADALDRRSRRRSRRSARPAPRRARAGAPPGPAGKTCAPAIVEQCDESVDDRRRPLGGDHGGRADHQREADDVAHDHRRHAREAVDRASRRTARRPAAGTSGISPTMPTAPRAALLVRVDAERHEVCGEPPEDRAGPGELEPAQGRVRDRVLSAPKRRTHAPSGPPAELPSLNPRRCGWTTPEMRERSIRSRVGPA